ncbi:hypothetical protein CHLNCDRAFT_141610 [Chlorella variabilis]|uniref:Protein kinase domain-containing protein n=1 Tax=Chlorella variabilis TaxID=554065 RepID=E1ZT59_CHLVA|nr:hypothetical protein CHLNCDRAFT_141610 [Chlorella variabilis]EFN50972.1 hypothetical protein CHLNCDRAFT_141610 [Chlorella variabilis]|eukprot:XP_005843074.1 hypothetical protein CHLNCDRAFT_141610 [Chlorella variabilis]
MSRQWGLDTTSLQLEAKELELVTGRDGRLVELGEGAYAVVYLGSLSGAQVAVKVYELDHGMDASVMWREAAMLRDAVHDHIVPLYGVAVKGRMVMLAMKLMRGGTLRAALQQADKREALRWRAGGRQAALEVASALVFLHTELNVLHSDLSSSNVLLDAGLTASISDLGVARFVGSSALSAGAFCLTHAAPEQVLGQRCTLTADIYSLGILLVELTTQQAVTRRGGWRLPLAPQECSPAVLALIERCTAADPLQRPPATQVLQQLQEDVG